MAIINNMNGDNIENQGNEELSNEIEEKSDVQETENSKKKGKKNISKKDTAMEWIKTIVIPIIIAIVILQFVRPTLVQQQSMLPTVQPNNYLIVYKMAYKLGEPKTGDIVVFESELKMDDNTNKYLIKRIIATEGQTIEVKDGEVYVDGNQLDEPYINGDYTPGDVPTTEVPENCVFVMGDNRSNSTDSRDSRVGFVNMDTVMGKVVLRLYPFNEMGTLYN